MGAGMADARMLSPPAASIPRPRPGSRALARWLFVVAALVLVMLIIGGITRLTELGLSITEWKPVTGAIPPLSEAAWEAEFARYKMIPEYQQLNRGMTLAAFKDIYFWEWLHRLLGRVIGLAFALPLLWFAARRAIPAGFGPRLAALFALGGLQGAIGWWMVQSGLSVRTDVSHVRLAVHLLTALLLLGGLVWTALDLRDVDRGRSRPARLRLPAAAALFILAVQLLFGAFVAGLNAGYVANSWPLMNDRFFPEGIGWNGAATFVNDPFLTHFIHRWWAWITAAALLLLARKAAAAGGRPAARALVFCLVLQILLGIATVESGIALPLAVAHQALGAMLVVLATAAAHAAGRRR